MRWRNIETDPPPMDGTVVLVWRESERGYDHARMGTDWFEGGVWQRSRRFMPPTHWMQLPEPPGKPTVEDELREALGDMLYCDRWERFSHDEVQDRAHAALNRAEQN